MATEEIVEAVEAVEEPVVQAVEVVRNNPILLAAVSVVAGTVGFALGWKIAKNHLTVEFEERLTTEMEQARDYYKRAFKVEEFETPESAAEALLEPEYVAALREYRGEGIQMEESVVVVSDEPVEVSVFANQADPNWNYDEEVMRRTPDVPYVITQEEFLENEPEHEQVTVTYYEGDDVLADENGRPIDDQDAVVGLGNLSRFGHGSGDKNVVYVRNEESTLDFMILHSRDHFTHAVLGFEHSEPRGKTRRFRHED